MAAAVNGTAEAPNSSAPGSSEDDEFWIFGYGSLIWKPPPHYDRRVPGWVTGYVRRFWQASQDHRGTPEAPGRVVTLIERSFWASLADAHDSAPDRVWGVAYRIAADKVDEVKEYLDIREINGYTVHFTTFHPSPSSFTTVVSTSSAEKEEEEEDKTKTTTTTTTTVPTETRPLKTLVYIGTPSNDQFVGSQDPQALAEHIHMSEGPSGLNRDYLLSLERALDELSPESGDAHVRDLSDRVREIIAAGKGAEVERVVSHDFTKVTSVDEQEETEKKE